MGKVSFADDSTAPIGRRTPVKTSDATSNDAGSFDYSLGPGSSANPSTQPLHTSRSGESDLIGRRKPVAFATSDETDNSNETRTTEQIERAAQFKRQRSASDAKRPSSRWTSLSSYLPSFTRDEPDPKTDANTAANKTIGTSRESSRVQAPPLRGAIKNWGSQASVGAGSTGPVQSSRPTQMTGPSGSYTRPSTDASRSGVYLHSTTVERKGFELTKGTNDSNVYTIYAPGPGEKRGRRAYRVPDGQGGTLDFIQEWDHNPSGMTHMLTFGGGEESSLAGGSMSQRPNRDATSGPIRPSDMTRGSTAPGAHPYSSLAENLDESGCSIAWTVEQMAQKYDTSRNYVLNTLLSAASSAVDRYAYDPRASDYPASLARDAITLTETFLSRSPGPEPSVGTGKGQCSQGTYDQWTADQSSARSAVNSCLSSNGRSIINNDMDVYSSMHSASCNYDHASMSGVWSELTKGTESVLEQDARSLAGLDSYMTMMGGIRRVAVQHGIPPPERTTANQRELISTAIRDGIQGRTSNATSYLDEHVRRWQRSNVGGNSTSNVTAPPPRRVQFAAA